MATDANSPEEESFLNPSSYKTLPEKDVIRLHVQTD
jgi:hypothetical protein